MCFYSNCTARENSFVAPIFNSIRLREKMSSVFYEIAMLILLYSKVDGTRRPFGQLPTPLTPLKYELSIQPYFPAMGISYPSARNFTFDANLSIELECLDDTKNITIHMLEIALQKSAISLMDVATNGRMSILDYVYDNETQQVAFFPKDVLKAGKFYKLHLKYSGKLDASALAGFYPSCYTENGQSKWMIATQFEATAARRVIPSFDEPFYKAVFEVTIIHPTSMIALSNNVDEETKSIGGGWSITRFAPTPKMSTYLLALAVCDFRSKSAYTTNTNTLVRVWARPSFINKIDYALFAAPKVLDYYINYYSVPFPLKKLDMLAVPDFLAGAMENWGLITYSESGLLYNESVSTPSERLEVATTIAHEIAHQWFGNLVTMEWWDDLWLNEGFATYMEYVGTDVISDGKFQQDDYFTAYSVTNALSLDQLSTSHPIFVPVNSPDEIIEIFDDISYAKGACLIRMLNYTITNKLLRKGLMIYLTKNAYKNANHNHLWSALSEAVFKEKTSLDWKGKPLNVTEFMNPWILQMGYPLINVIRRYGEKRKIATLTQEHFLLSDNASQANEAFLNPPYNFTWYVPIWYQTGDKGVQSTWLSPQQTLTIFTDDDTKWLLVNYERAAFCRVNYDDHNWQLLIKQLQTDHEKIHLKNRVQLLDDSMQLAKANRLSYEIALNLTLYLLHEKDFMPWSTGINGLTFFKGVLMGTSGYQDYKNYFSALIYPTYSRVGWDDSKESVDEVFSHSLRAKAIGLECWLELDECVQHARKEFERFAASCSKEKAMSSSCSPISISMRHTVYCEGAKDENNHSNWELLWSLYATEEVAAERDRLMDGLACTKKLPSIYKLLNEAINATSTTIRRQDGASAIQSFASNDIARPLLWPFVVKNWETISKLYGHGLMLGLDWILDAAASPFNTGDELELLKNFYHDHLSELSTAKRSMEQLIERTETKVQWKKKNGDLVMRWFKKNQL